MKHGELIKGYLQYERIESNEVIDANVYIASSLHNNNIRCIYNNIYSN